MDVLNSYGFIIAACLVIIISYLFNQLSLKTNIPSVLLLIILGFFLNQGRKVLGIAPGLKLMPVLEVLGIIGLIMIVLEAALELKLSREKAGLLWKSFAVSLISLVTNAILIAWIIKLIWVLDWFISFIYATPLAIISSAIVIPTVSRMPAQKKEFLIFESTFSDILGIMVFYFLLEAGNHSGNNLALNIGGSILLTVVVSFAASYGLLFLFQKIKGGTKLFLLIAVLVFLYSAGKLFHLSSLLIILVFGLILSNRRILAVGKLKKYFDLVSLDKIYNDFMLVTTESSFIVRTFFFLVFGMSITLAAIVDSRAILVSLSILAIVFVLRYVIIRIFYKKDSFPQWQMAPRGLITILLFFSIPKEYQIEDFAKFEGVLMIVILVSSAVMAWSMISFQKSMNINKKEIEDTDGKIPYQDTPGQITDLNNQD